MRSPRAASRRSGSCGPLVAFPAPAAAGSEGPRLTDLSAGELAARQQVDLAALATYRSGLARTVAFARSHPELFPATRPDGARLLAAAERDAVRAAWKSMLDYTLALESIENFHDDFALLTDTGARARSFHVANGAFLAAYRFALEFIDLAAGDPKLAVILNDPVEDLGLPAGAYDRYKFRFLNVAAATRFAAYALAGRLSGSRRTPRAPATQARTPRASSPPAAGGARRSLPRTPSTCCAASAPGPSSRCRPASPTWMGDTKVLRHERSLISPAQIEALRARMLPATSCSSAASGTSPTSASPASGATPPSTSAPRRSGAPSSAARRSAAGSSRAGSRAAISSGCSSAPSRRPARRRSCRRSTATPSA